MRIERPARVFPHSGGLSFLQGNLLSVPLLYRSRTDEQKKCARSFTISRSVGMFVSEAGDGDMTRVWFERESMLTSALSFVLVK